MEPVTLVGVVFGVIDMPNGEEAELVFETSKSNTFKVFTTHEMADALKHSRGKKFVIEDIEESE